jgi:hypothetical protein
MKNFVKWLGIIALVTVIGFAFTACGDGSDGAVTTYAVTVNDGSGSGSYAAGTNVTITATVPSGQQFTNWTVNSGGATLANANNASTSFTMPANAVTVTANFTASINLSLDGVWQLGSSTALVTISGSTGVITQWPTTGGGITQSAFDKGYIKIGDPYYKNLTKTGDLTWTGQVLQVTYNNSAPNVATGTGWTSVTITLNANGQTYYDGGTWTRTLSLDGVWQLGSSTALVTISGSTGIITQWPTTGGGITQSAFDKGYIKIGDPYYRNLSKTGDLTWTGQVLQVTYNNSAPSVATGTGWTSVTITLNANGQTYYDGGTWTRQ